MTGRRHFGPLVSSASFCGANVPIVKSSIFSLPETFKWFLGESGFWRSTSFFFFVTEEWGFDFALACSSPARVSDEIFTSQNHSKVEYLETWLFISKLAKVPIVSFWTFWSEKFVKGLFLFKKYPDYKLFLLLLSPRSLCSCGSFSDAKKPKINFSFFSLPEMPGVLNWAYYEIHVDGWHFNFCFFFLQKWGFEFAPTLGNTVSVGDQLTANQGYKCGTHKNLSWWSEFCKVAGSIIWMRFQFLENF